MPWMFRLNNLQPRTKYTLYYVGVYKQNTDYVLMKDTEVRSIAFETPDVELIYTYQTYLQFFSLFLIAIFTSIWRLLLENPCLLFQIKHTKSDNKHSE